MAFIGQTDETTQSDILDDIQKKMASIANVANERDRIHAEAEGKGLEIIVGGVIWAWLIYRFLIKR